MEIGDLITRFEKVRPSAGKRNEYTCRCPAHADKGPSLSVSESDGGKILMHCFAGCSVEEICGAIGLTVGDLSPDRSRDHRRRPANVISAAAALRIIERDALLVTMVALRIANHQPITKDDAEAVASASVRISEALTLSGTTRR